jgi:hypothetical protein
MAYKTDIEIAPETPVWHIREIAETLSIEEKYAERSQSAEDGE